MTFTFVSNYINHHQIPLADEMYKILGEGYCFIQTEKMAQERVNMGWEDIKALPYLKNYYEDPDSCRTKVMGADIVMFGGVEDESYILPRIEAKKIVLRYSESIYKDGRWKFITPRGLKKKYHDHIRFKNYPVYLLCAGAYVAGDFALIGAYKGKCFKWGYFTKFIEYDVKWLLKQKPGLNCKTYSILMAGRLISLKHIETAISAAKILSDKGLCFKLTIIGDGEEKDRLKGMALGLGIKEHVEFLDFMPPERVRQYMEGADIYLFCSDRHEGWGAVLNEALNSGCCVVASASAGAVPYLIKHDENGLIYKCKDFNDCAACITSVIENKDKQASMAKAAYTTIKEEWNPKMAADRLIELSKKLLNNELIYCESGPISQAKG